jgi:hypothetical protein
MKEGMPIIIGMRNGSGDKMTMTEREVKVVGQEDRKKSESGGTRGQEEK